MGSTGCKLKKGNNLWILMLQKRIKKEQEKIGFEKKKMDYS